MGQRHWKLLSAMGGGQHGSILAHSRVSRSFFSRTDQLRTLEPHRIEVSVLLAKNVPG